MNGSRGSLWMVLVLSPLIGIINAHKILLLPANGYSHVGYFAAMGEGLIQHGHQVYMVHSPGFNPPEYVEKLGIKLMVYNETEPEHWGGELEQGFVAEAIENPINIIDAFRSFPDVLMSLTHNLLGDQHLFLKLKNLQLDLVMIEGFHMNRADVILPYRLGVNHVTITTLYDPWQIRIPGIPSFVPFPMHNYYTEKMSFMQRAKNLWAMIDWAFWPKVPQMDDELVKTYAPEKPFVPLLDLSRQTLLWMINTDNAVDYARPTMPNVIYTGGLSAKPAKRLPPQLETFLNSSENGAILLSFGSTAQVLPPQITEKLLEAFQQLNHQVIWKYKGKALENVPSNVHLMEWLPQGDILAHPNLKVFITHSGNNGQFEALYHGVPTIMFPIYGDQFYNAKRMEYKGYGITISLKTFTVKELVDNIEEIFMNPSYQEKIMKGSEIFKSAPMNPKDRAVYWIEHVITYGGSHLRSHALDMPWYQYAMLDIAACVFIITLIICILVKKLISCLFSCCMDKTKAKME